MPNIQGKFADQNDIVLTNQILTSNNNAATFNAALAETDHLRGSTVILQPNGLLATVANPVPNVTAAAQGTVGAALSGQGQGGTASQQPGGGGNPCFTYDTLITLPEGHKFIKDIECGDYVLAFDETGKRAPKLVTDTQSHLVEGFCEIAFDDNTVTCVDPKQTHRYWTMNGFAPIRDLDMVYHWTGAWTQRRIVDRQVIVRPTVLYNCTVQDLHCYIANGDAVSNLKPILPPDGEGGGPTL